MKRNQDIGICRLSNARRTPYGCYDDQASDCLAALMAAGFSSAAIIDHSRKSSESGISLISEEGVGILIDVRLERLDWIRNSLNSALPAAPTQAMDSWIPQKKGCFHAIWVLSENFLKNLRI